MYKYIKPFLSDSYTNVRVLETHSDWSILRHVTCTCILQASKQALIHVVICIIAGLHESGSVGGHEHLT